MDYITKAVIDATAADWITVAAYFLTAALCYHASRWAFLRRQEKSRVFWIIGLVGLLLLGINEPLDLQAIMTSVLRDNANDYGWYENRRPLQHAFVLTLLASGIVGAAIVFWTVKGTKFSIRLAVVGFISIGVFILFRAASFHKLDELLGQGYRAFDLGWFQELAGVLIIAVATQLYVRGR